ncbi:hypothetical protein [Pelagibius marinus]|uniref:hypothetical protein n=1 Tax=Pelagibius marinus TaxID=2762760 RepID=UPI0018723C92|nr:hypothetical protein [Pelagibius marinus]
MPQTTRFLLSPIPAVLVAGLSGALPAGPARADSFGSEVTYLSPPRIEVASNGSSYHRTNPLANLVADVHVEVDTGLVGGVKSWNAFLGLAREDGGRMWFQSFGKSKSYPWYDRPNSVNRTERLELPEYAWGAFVRTQCNALADHLRAQGLPDTAIFGQDRKLELGVVSNLDVNNTGPGSNSIFVGATPWDEVKKIEVVCKKWPGAAIPQASTTLAAPPSKVVNKGLSIYEQYGITGVCKIRLDGWITTDQKNAEVSFRYKNQQGKQSQLWTVNTGESKTATFSHWYNIANTEWAETGFVRMVGVSHNFRSEWAEYTMECTEGGPQSLATDRPLEVTLKAVPQGKVMAHGRICPETVKLIAVLEGLGNASGEMMFFGTAFFSQRYDFSITPGQKVLQGADAPLRWNSVPAPAQANMPLTQSRQFGLKVTDQHGRIIASVPQHPFVLGCSTPTVNPSVQPAPGGLTVERRRAGAGATPPRTRGLPPQAPQPQPAAPRRLQPRAPE